MPVRRAQYAALVARALPSMTLEQIEWELPLTKGWALVHAGSLLAGEPMMWPDRKLSKTGRWWEKIREWMGR